MAAVGIKPSSSIDTISLRVIGALQFFFWAEIMRLVFFRGYHQHPNYENHFMRIWFNIILATIEGMTALIAIKKRSFNAFTIMKLAIIIHFVCLCLYAIQLTGEKDLYGSYYFLFARIHAVIGICILAYVVSQFKVIERYIQDGDKIEALNVAYFISNGSPYPSGSSNTANSTPNSNPNNVSPNHPQPNCTVMNPAMLPSAAPVVIPAQSNCSPYPSKLAYTPSSNDSSPSSEPTHQVIPTALSNPAETPVYTNVSSNASNAYPYQASNQTYPTSAANPSVYPSLDTPVPIQSTDPPVHPSA